MQEPISEDALRQLQEHARRWDYVADNALWYRHAKDGNDEPYALLAVKLPYDVNLTCRPMVEQAIDDARKDAASNGAPADTEALRKERALQAVVEAFVAKQGIHCVETIYQTDRVLENASALIEELCNIVGYAKLDDDD